MYNLAVLSQGRYSTCTDMHHGFNDNACGDRSATSGRRSSNRCIIGSNGPASSSPDANTTLSGIRAAVQHVNAVGRPRLIP